MPTNMQRALAFHEAGHAVIALHLSLAVKSATIIKGDDCQGLVRLAGAFPKTAAAAEKHAMVSLAGERAQRRVSSRSVRRHHGAGDRDAAVNFMMERSSSPKEMQCHFEWLVARVDDMLKSQPVWLQVEALADALLAKGTLTGQEVKVICHDAIRSAIQKREEVA